MKNNQVHCELRIDPSFAKEVATQLMANDALGTHARDERVITNLLAAYRIAVDNEYRLFSFGSVRLIERA